MKTILVTGSNGLVGQKLVDLLAKNKEVNLIATSRNFNKIEDVQGYSFELLDITNKTEVDYLISRYNPDTIINTASEANTDYCEDHRDEAWKINVEAMKYLSEAANRIGAHLIHLSTDFVFDGNNGPYSEENWPNPVSYYGYTKLEGEKVVEQLADKWSVVRTVLVYGVNFNMSRSNILLWAKNALENKQPIKVVNDQFRTPTLAEDLAHGCIEVALREKEGLYHISGNEYMSVYDIVMTIAEVFNYDKSLISTISTLDLNEKAKRPPRSGFVINKAINDLDYCPHSLREGLNALVDLFNEKD